MTTTTFENVNFPFSPPPRILFLLFHYIYYTISLLTSARSGHGARHYIIVVRHTHTCIIYYTDTFLLQIQPMHLRGVPIVCSAPGSHEKPVWGPEG